MTATQGTLKSMQFSTTNANFEARFDVNTDIKLPSVLYYNQEYWYNHGINFVLYNSNDVPLVAGHDYTLDLTSQANYAKFTVTNPTLNGKTLTIQVTPKQATLSTY